MKNLAILSCCLIAVVVSAQTPPPLPTKTGAIQITSLDKKKLYWDYPTNLLSTNLTFVLYQSTDMINWTEYQQIIGTNLSCIVTVARKQQFFKLTAKQDIFESDPSNVVEFQYPLPGYNFRIEDIKD